MAARTVAECRCSALIKYSQDGGEGRLTQWNGAKRKSMLLCQPTVGSIIGERESYRFVAFDKILTDAIRHRQRASQSTLRPCASIYWHVIQNVRCSAVPDIALRPSGHTPSLWRLTDVVYWSSRRRHGTKQKRRLLICVSAPNVIQKTVFRGM